jgi:hypothetical protein
MDKHEGHKIGAIFGNAGISDYCLDCSEVLGYLSVGDKKEVWKVIDLSKEEKDNEIHNNA